MKFSLGYSPCPNDCFIFDALVHKRIDTEGIDFDVALHDVQELNRLAVDGKLDITKLSYAAFSELTGTYQLLNSGSALGFNCGPLLICKRDPEKILTKLHEEPDKVSIAIPGENTTANFLLSIAFPQALNRIPMLFSDIEKAVLENRVDAGLIIHENRFTYMQKGLQKILDLGEYWDSIIQAPIPLGGIAMHRRFNSELIKSVDRLIKKSVLYAFEHPEISMPYVRKHAQEMSEDVMKQHINLYVNQFSVDLGETGIAAVRLLLNKAIEAGLISSFNSDFIIGYEG